MIYAGNGTMNFSSTLKHIAFVQRVKILGKMEVEKNREYITIDNLKIYYKRY
jgi:hypothetical protein